MSVAPPAAERGQEILLSICVPTFNRAPGLANLFRNFEVIKKAHGDRIEICVSNNHSPDDTPKVIEEWRERLDLRVQHQPRNIGGTLNMIAVMEGCRGRWTVLIGDDDEFEPAGFAALLDYIEPLGQDDWVLAGIAGTSGEEQVLGNLQTGVYPKARFRRLMLGTTLHRYGFMGMHVFPAAARPVMLGLTLETAQPWPHIATMLRQLEHGQVHVFRPSIIVQAAGGGHLFWTAADLAQITLSKLRILEATSKDVPAHRTFHRLMMLSDLYSLPSLGLLLAWKIYENDSFGATALGAYRVAYRRTGPLQPLTWPHLALVALLRATPNAVLRGLLHAVGRGHYVARYQERKSRLKDFDGIKRGI